MEHRGDSLQLSSINVLPYSSPSVKVNKYEYVRFENYWFFFGSLIYPPQSFRHSCIYLSNGMECKCLYIHVIGCVIPATGVESNKKVIALIIALNWSI